MQTLLIYVLAVPLVILVVLNVLGPIVAIRDWLRNPVRLR